jgi:hypothetical protein
VGLPHRFHLGTTKGTPAPSEVERKQTKENTKRQPIPLLTSNWTLAGLRPDFAFSLPQVPCGKRLRLFSPEKRPDGRNWPDPFLTFCVMYTPAHNR